MQVWKFLHSLARVTGVRTAAGPSGFEGESMHKRVYGAVALAGVTALALSACGGSSTEELSRPVDRVS